jgi:hypothetical protein
MTTKPIVPGLRPFTAGAWMLVVFAFVHSIAVVKSHVATPSEADARLEEILRAHVYMLGPIEITAWGTVQILSISYSLLLYASGAAALMVRRPAIMAGRLRSFAVLYLLLCLALDAVAIANRFPPPAVFATIAAVLFAWSAARARPQPM